jgi:hypothetical protein
MFLSRVLVVDAGGWGEWSMWSYCSATCGRGKMERSRHCDSPEPVGGGKPCVGLLTQQKDCSVRDCPGLWSCDNVDIEVYVDIEVFIMPFHSKVMNTICS